MKVIVIGAGIMGLSTAWALAKQGADVTVLEQGALPNPVASSVDDHRLIRHPYGARHGYAAMVVEAFRAWDEMWADLGESHYHQTGTLVLGGRDNPKAAVDAEGVEKQGLSVEWLTPAQMAAAYPLLKTDGLSGGFRLPTGGTLRCGRIVTGLIRHLTLDGMDIRQGAQVIEADPVTGRVTLAGGDVLQADKVVVAAGAWLTRLRPEMAARVTPSRQVVIYVRPPAGTGTLWRQMPCILDIDDNNNGFYLVPPAPGTGLKIGDHIFSRSGDPTAERRVAPEEAAAILAKCAPRFHRIEDYAVADAKACFYTVEPDERFIVEEQDRMIILSACSGHGFKFGAVVGQRTADLVLGRRAAADVRRWAAGEAA